MSSSCCGQIGHCIRNATSIIKIKVLKWVFFFFFSHFSFRLSSHMFYLLNNKLYLYLTCISSLSVSRRDKYDGADNGSGPVLRARGRR